MKLTIIILDKIKLLAYYKQDKLFFNLKTFIMDIFFKYDLFVEKKYYLISHNKKEYLSGDPKKDNVLYEAALITGTGIKTETVLLNTSYGETEEEALKGAKIFCTIFLPKYKNISISGPFQIDSENNLAWVEKRIK